MRTTIALAALCLSACVHVHAAKPTPSTGADTTAQEEQRFGALNVRDGAGVSANLKTTLDGTDHVPHHNIDVIAAGDNNIGNVDVATLPALPAGANNIGDVDVASLPALPAGTNNIGDVDVASLPALPTGSNTIGTVNTATQAAPSGFSETLTVSSETRFSVSSVPLRQGLLVQCLEEGDALCLVYFVAGGTADAFALAPGTAVWLSIDDVNKVYVATTGSHGMQAIGF